LVQHWLQRNDLRLAQRKYWLGYRLCRNTLCCAFCGTYAALCRCSACCRPICPNRSHFVLLTPAIFTSSRDFCLSNCISQLQIYLRRSTMCLSVRLLWRVFLPNVGKAQGVCG